MFVGKSNSVGSMFGKLFSACEEEDFDDGLSFDGPRSSGNIESCSGRRRRILVCGCCNTGDCNDDDGKMVVDVP